LEATSPLGTTVQVAVMLADISGLMPEQIHVAYCPERVLPVRILLELISNDRVIGGLAPAGEEVGQAFYTTFYQGDLLATTARTAEFLKLTENRFRDGQHRLC
jgi:UDP-N-acetyl-D-mannosaminuronic acid dehydrogenase